MDANQNEPKSLLADLRSHHIVHVSNPLTDQPESNRKGDFSWTVARSVPNNDPRYRDPYIDKLNLRNDDHTPMGHVTQAITIPAGKSMKLPGDVAQVIVKHLVDELINRSGQKSQLTNPTLRREYEELVVLNINDLRDEVSTKSIEEQLQKQIDDLNKSPEKASISNAIENSFPDLQPGSRTAENAPTSPAVTGRDKLVAGQKAAAPEPS